MLVSTHTGASHINVFAFVFIFGLLLLIFTFECLRRDACTAIIIYTHFWRHLLPPNVESRANADS